MKRRVSPSLASRTATTSEPGDEPIVADSQQRSARHVADARGLDNDAPGRPRAKRSYQASTFGVTKPSSVARQGTIAGTQVRAQSRARRREPG